LSPGVDFACQWPRRHTVQVQLECVQRRAQVNYYSPAS
jgi:hypothetical protein